MVLPRVSKGICTVTILNYMNLERSGTCKKRKNYHVQYNLKGVWIDILLLCITPIHIGFHGI